MLIISRLHCHLAAFWPYRWPWSHHRSDRIDEDRDDLGTELGPANVALHAVGVAVELGDAGHALDLARDIKPERR